MCLKLVHVGNIFPQQLPFSIGRLVCLLNNLCGDFQHKQRMDEDGDCGTICCILLQMLAASAAFLSALICLKGILHYSVCR